jgi:hypothetical protein
MRRNRAAAPWSAGNRMAAKRGRPRKDAPQTNTQRECIWPDPDDGTCGRGIVQGLAVCPQHAQILSHGPGRACAWPGCAQAAPFRALCMYHDKRCRGLLLEAGR